MRKFDTEIASKNPKITKGFIESVKLQYYCSHPNIVPIYDIFVYDFKICIIEEYMQSGSLKNYIKNKPRKPNESEIAERISEICSGLEFIHQRQKPHGGINSNDIMVTNVNYMIIQDTCKISGIKIDIN